MNFTAKAIPMTRLGLADALEKLELGAGQAAALWSVFEVETAGITNGFGFRADRKPQMLFERHKFREFTQSKFDTEAPDISGSQGAYGTFSSQYGKLQKAIDLCVKNGLGIEPALKSASWGIGQVMGFNHAASGYASAEEMVVAMVKTEDAQLSAMVNFMRDAGLANALKTHNWASFAAKYNGRNYASNQYDVKLEQTYARLSARAMPDLEVRRAQAALLLLGFAPGKIDGAFGDLTRKALCSFQISAGLSVTGELDSASFAELGRQAF